MAVLKGVTLSLPHISLSRTNSAAPSRVTTPTEGLSSESSAPRTTSDEPKMRQPTSNLSGVDLGPSASAPGVRRRSFGPVATLAGLRRSSSFRSSSTGPAPALSTLTTAEATVSRPSSDSNLPHRHGVGAAGQVRGIAAQSLSKPRSKSSAPPTTRAGVSTTKSQHPANASASVTPAASSGKGPGGAPLSRSTTPLHNLEESYIGKISLRLGEAVNHVFVSPAGPTAGPVDPCWKGRPPPKYLKARELGDLVSHELLSASHDQYLTRTLLRGPILKALSLFLSRLTALLQPVLEPPFSPVTAKELDWPQLPLTLRYNLHIVRCAYELRQGLERASRLSDGFGVILTPWRAKLDDVIARVMNPLVGACKRAVMGACARARVVEPVAHPSATTTVLDAATASVAKVAAAPRVLTIGRTATSGGMHDAVQLVPGTPPVVGGPAWIRDLSAILSAVERLFTKLECGVDADRWSVTVGTCALWKSVLALACRRIAADDATPSSVVGGKSASLVPPVIGQNGGTASPPTSATRTLFKTHKAKPPSPSESPNLAASTGNQVHAPPALALSTLAPPVGGVAANGNSATNFIRLIGELELLEMRLKHFAASALSVPPESAELHHAVMPGVCRDVAQCGLCKTGRQFDVESSSDDEDGDSAHASARRGCLVQIAMREALQVLSAMIVVVRASGGKATSCTLSDALGALAIEQHATVAAKLSGLPGGATSKSGTAAAPVTPAALLQLDLDKDPMVKVPAADSRAAEVCPTLVHALDTIPTVLLLHLLASRVPPSAPFRLPNDIWGVDWTAYFEELRGFVTAEEMAPEIAWEMQGEVDRASKVSVGLSAGAKDALAVLAQALRCKAGIEEGVEV